MSSGQIISGERGKLYTYPPVSYTVTQYPALHPPEARPVPVLGEVPLPLDGEAADSIISEVVEQFQSPVDNAT